jgi:polysaccharide deacetylase 2 family uncharacterized protein YibQ
MKSKVKQKTAETPKNKYPYLGENNRTGRIVFFTSPRSGMQVNMAKLGTRGLGYYDSTWAEGLFVPFSGTVTLSND